MPSCHAEVRAIKYVKSIKKSLKKCVLFCVRWKFDKNINDWILEEGVPCHDCYKFACKNGIHNFGISSKKYNGLFKVDSEYVKKHTKQSRGRLYGK